MNMNEPLEWVGNEGIYMEKDSNIQSMIRLSLYPTDLVQYWNRCGLTADFVASFMTYCYPDHKVVKNSFSVILNELLENAVKYSIKGSADIDIMIFSVGKDTVVFEVQNQVDVSHYESLRTYSHELSQIADLEKKYLDILKQDRVHPDSSGLGLITLKKDFKAQLGFSFYRVSGSVYRVCVQSIIKIEEMLR